MKSKATCNALSPIFSTRTKCDNKTFSGKVTRKDPPREISKNNGTGKGFYYGSGTKFFGKAGRKGNKREIGSSADDEEFHSFLLVKEIEDENEMEIDEEEEGDDVFRKLSLSFYDKTKPKFQKKFQLAGQQRYAIQTRIVIKLD